MENKYEGFEEFRQSADDFTLEEKIFISTLEAMLPILLARTGWELDNSAQDRESFAKCFQYLAVKAFKLNSAIGEGEID